MNAAYLADSIGKSFGARAVLKSATAWAKPGSISVIMGRNGSGKTTLLRAGLGLITMDFGVVRFEGVHQEPPRLWRLAAGGLFYVPDRDLLGRRESLRQHVRMIEDRFDEASSDGILERLGVGHLLDQRSGEMSGGERRRAELALALVRGPRCLIADEPLTEVEPKDRATVVQALRELAEAGCAILLTGHEVEDLFEAADEIIWMVAGTTHFLGHPSEARRHHQFRREYLGPCG